MAWTSNGILQYLYNIPHTSFKHQARTHQNLLSTLNQWPKVFHRIQITLIHWGWEMHIRVSKLTVTGSDNGLLPWWVTHYYLNQCWNIVDLVLRNKIQWNDNCNLFIFIQENAFEYVVCEMAAILSQPQYVNLYVTETGSIPWLLRARALIQYKDAITV